MGGKFEFSSQWGDLVLSVGNGTRLKIPSKIKSPLLQNSLISLMSLKQIPTANNTPKPHTRVANVVADHDKLLTQ